MPYTETLEFWQKTWREGAHEEINIFLLMVKYCNRA